VQEKNPKYFLVLDVGFKTDLGRERHNNEDSLVFEDRRVESEGGIAIAVVADGIGGHQAGEVASQIAVSKISSSIFAPRGKKTLPEHLEHVIIQANTSILEEAKQDAAKKNMGTTAVVAMISDADLYIANVGDSRCYCFYKDKLTQISRDHTYANALGLTTKQAQDSPMGSKLTRCLGREEDLKVDLFGRRLHKGEKILLCSDGLTLHLDDEELKDELRKDLNSKAIVDELIEKTNSRGGRDNITIIVITILDIKGSEKPATIKQVKRENIPPLWWVTGILFFLMVLFLVVLLFMKVEIAEILFGPP